MRFLDRSPKRSEHVLPRVVLGHAEQSHRLGERHPQRRRNAARRAPITPPPDLIELGGDPPRTARHEHHAAPERPPAPKLLAIEPGGLAGTTRHHIARRYLDDLG